MFKDLHEVEEMQERMNPAERGVMDDQCINDEQVPVISAYIETLPGGLIGDEI